MPEATTSYRAPGPAALDRGDPKATGRFLEALFPDPELRRNLLSILARSIEEAHRNNPGAWSLTLGVRHGYLRLNVGRILALDLKPDRTIIVLERSSRRRGDEDSRALPGVVWRTLAPQNLAAEWQSFSASHQGAIARAARQVRKSPYRQSHSPGVLAYMAESLNHPLPRPEHNEPSPQQLDPSRIEEVLRLLRSQYPGWDGFDHPAFSKDEIGYKRATIAKAKQELAESELRRLLDEELYDEFLHRLDKIGKDNNLLYRSTPNQGDLNILYQKPLDKASLCSAVFDLLYGEGDSPERLGRYLSWVRGAGLPSKWTFPTYFLFVCHPETEIFVKPGTTKAFLGLLGIDEEIRGEVTPAKYAHVRDIAQGLMDALVDYEPSDMVDIQSVFWVCGRAVIGVRYWKIAPGEGAWQWEECRKGNFIAIGWDRLGDISGLTFEQFEARRADIEREDLDYTRKGAGQVWTFSQIREGDKIVANRGLREVVGIGTVIGPYYFVPEVRYGHRLPVDWEDVEPRSVNQPGWLSTLQSLKREDFERIAKLPSRKGPVSPPLNEPYVLSQCAAKTGFDEVTLERWVRAIHRKKQAILYGPPGTGKTYVARELARHLIGGGDGFQELVQFHPNYSYEEFIQGIRPEPRPEGGLDYPLKKGRFLEFCDTAREKNGICVLIIDEINRANLSRVFGELMYLLEYRGSEIPLAAGRSFSIPENVRILGTMNTADRSIALVDHALRRRFAFIHLKPQFEILRRSHPQDGALVDRLISLLERVNQEIANPHYEIGITFFLEENLSQQIEDIWRMEISPYLEEYFFDQPEKFERFRWEQVRRELGL